jgi:cytochrome c
LEEEDMLGRSSSDAKDWVAKAIAYYKANGKAKALAEFSNPEGLFNEDEMYIFVMNLKGTVLAHGADEKYIGHDFTDIMDYNGKRYFRDVVESANSQGSGVVEYSWLNPLNKTVEPKNVYFQRADDLIICSGVYQGKWENQY